jgi:hypothetical protein
MRAARRRHGYVAWRLPLHRNIPMHARSFTARLAGVSLVLIDFFCAVARQPAFAAQRLNIIT